MKAGRLGGLLLFGVLVLGMIGQHLHPLKRRQR